MDELLEPPNDFVLELPVLEWPAARWFRVHDNERAALYFDRAPSYRFNAPAQEFGILYMSEGPEGAFAESLLGGRARPPVLTESRLSARALTTLSWRPLILADFAGLGLAPLGLDARIATGDCYPLCRRWAAWVHRHPRQVDGICYPARSAPSVRSIALFDRAGGPDSVEVLEKSFLQAKGLLAPWGQKLVKMFKVAIVSG